MEKQCKQVIQGTAAMFAMATTILLVITLKFVIYASSTWNPVLRRIGGEVK